MALTIAQNEATAAKRRFFFEAKGLDGISRLTGLTFSGSDLQYSKGYGTEANFAGTVTERADGFYIYEPTVGEVDTKGPIALRSNRSDIYPFNREHQVV